MLANHCPMSSWSVASVYLPDQLSCFLWTTVSLASFSLPDFTSLILILLFSLSKGTYPAPSPSSGDRECLDVYPGVKWANKTSHHCCEDDRKYICSEKYKRVSGFITLMVIIIITRVAQALALNFLRAEMFCINLISFPRPSAWPRPC